MNKFNDIEKRTNQNDDDEYERAQKSSKIDTEVQDDEAINYLTEYEINNHLNEGTEYDTVNSPRKSNNNEISIRIAESDFVENTMKENKDDVDLSDVESDASEVEDSKANINYKLKLKYIIIDCSPINFIDTVGIKAVKQLIADYGEIGIKVYLAECNGIFTKSIYF